MTSPTLEAYAWPWLAARRVRGRPLAPRTTELYRWQLRRHVLPHLGHRLLTDLTRDEVRRWHATITAAAGAPTAAKCYRLLRAICATAVGDELLERSPCRLPGAGQEWSPERPLVTVPQVLALADAVGPRWRCVVLLAALCSLRFGELAALRRPQVDLARRTLAVLASVSDLPGGVRHVGPPKSRAGRRVLALPPVLVPELEQHLASYAEPAQDGLVFVGPHGGPLRSSGFGTRVWRPATRSVGVPGLHFHDLRHAGNTLAAATGASLAELMARMGHSTVDAALRYQHATLARDAVIAAALSDLVADAQGEEGASTDGLRPSAQIDGLL